MANTISIETVAKVLEMSENDIVIWDILSEFDEEEEILEFIEENENEFEMFFNTALHHIINRLKVRIAFAKNGEDK